ncbi:hypothetical protein L6R29_06505 [Myxococcota bacterium]|nr:hypothetical protein [Myxococcota bacterium]
MPRFSIWNRCFLRRSVTGFVFLAALGGVLAFRQEMRLQHAMLGQKSSDLYYLPSPPTLKRLSVGYRAFLSDLVWIRALLYAGEHFSDKRSSIRWVTQYFEAIYALDPKYRFAYEWAATLNVYNRHQHTRREMMESLYILQKGREQFPDDYYFPNAIAMAYIFEIDLGRQSKAQLHQDHLDHCQRAAPERWPRDTLVRKTRVCMKRIGARYLMEAAAKPNAPPYIGSQAAGLLRQNQGDPRLICNYLTDILWRSNNPESLQHIRERLHRYCASQRTQIALCQEQRFTKRWQTQAPYMPRALFGHVSLDPSLREKQPFLLTQPSPDSCISPPR